MMRAILAALAGYAVWSVLWFATGAGVDVMYPEIKPDFQAGGKITAIAPLSIYLVASVICSILAGKTARSFGGARASGAVLGMGFALLTTGVIIQVSYWDQMPVWFHLPFLILILPVCKFAGRASAPE